MTSERHDDVFPDTAFLLFSYAACRSAVETVVAILRASRIVLLCPRSPQRPRLEQPRARLALPHTAEPASQTSPTSHNRAPASHRSAPPVDMGKRKRDSPPLDPEGKFNWGFWKHSPALFLLWLHLTTPPSTPADVSNSILPPPGTLIRKGSMHSSYGTLITASSLPATTRAPPNIFAAIVRHCAPL